MSKIIVRHVTVAYDEDVQGYVFADVETEPGKANLYVEKVDNFTVLAENQTAAAFVHYFAGEDGLD